MNIKTVKPNLNIFNKIALVLVFFIAIFAGFTRLVYAQAEPINIYLFYGLGCPHCAKERQFLKDLREDYPDQITIYEYEIYYEKEDSNTFLDVIDYLDIEVAGVPFLVIGEKYFVGYESDNTTGADIKAEIDRCIQDGCKDNLSELLLGETTPNGSDPNAKIQSGSNTESTSPIYLNTYIFGKVNLKDISLPVATILIALVDGFNPCAMWILIFLITMLINMKDKKKLYLLGSTFIFVSGLVYFLFLLAWFKVFDLIGYVSQIKIIIGIVAIVSGILHIKSALSSKGGCRATNETQRKGIIDKIKKIIAERSFLLAMVGIITLAISVNLIELACSAGLPAIYTNLLSTIKLTPIQYYLYLILYVLVFMLDDLIVFFVAIKTFEVTGIAKKYTKWSSLIGGIVILIIGIILIVKPEILMFG
ncbi:hypothetical protein JW962_02855 [Candidatus Dojkabacteria bacterium]|nr:hypothetical protein [Candidatus Dojkabacteria bacterium]